MGLEFLVCHKNEKRPWKLIAITLTQIKLSSCWKDDYKVILFCIFLNIVHI